jgi:bifunctional enzyme CysN/CysC
MSDVRWQVQSVTKEDRIKRNLKSQRPALLWLTGLSGSGKSTLAAALELELFSRGFHTYSLDGDNVRHGLCRDLGFSERDRDENIRRVGEVAALMVDAGLIVIASFISPFRRERQMVREMLAPGEFFEVYLSAPLQVCEQRDPKGLYQKARAGEIGNFTGISSPYEPPEAPEVIVDSSKLTLEESVVLVIDALKAEGAI